MADPSPSDTCPNCGTPLTDRFCAGCGQRVLPAEATLRELAMDAWDDLSGYDGRFARTLRMLLLRPGELTREVLAGRRQRYIGPVRLYLFASFVFFLTAAFAPALSLDGSGARATVTNNNERRVVALDAAGSLSDEERAAVLAQLERAPWWLAAMLRPMFTDPTGFRTRLYANIPRVLFALVPVFALVVGLAFRGGWLQHFVFSLHVHAGVFLLLIPRELSRFTGNLLVLGATEIASFTAIIGYVLTATRRVYGERWGRLLLRLVPVAVLYLVAYGIAMLIAIAWTASAAQG